METFLRLLHLSDLHFFRLSLNPMQFGSKRWVGNVNYLFKRRKEHQQQRLDTLPAFCQEHGITHVLITGDLTTTAYDPEFELARSFVSNLHTPTFVIPGNHDHYTREAHRVQRFYDFFPAPGASHRFPFHMREHLLQAHELGHDWWLVAMDTAIATPLFSSNGYFSPDLEARLIETLSLFSPNEKVILMNHFPLFDNDLPMKTLKRSDRLRALLSRFPQVKLYLHGHTHRHCIADLRPSHFPILLDAGSTTHRNQGTMNLIHIADAGCAIHAFRYDPSIHWTKTRQTSLLWT